jgi:hypothetical protein
LVSVETVPGDAKSDINVNFVEVFDVYLERVTGCHAEANNPGQKDPVDSQS